MMFLWAFVCVRTPEHLYNAQYPLMSKPIACWVQQSESSTWLWRTGKNTSQQPLSAHFNYLLLGIPASTAPHREPTPAAHPLTYTHSIRHPNGLRVRKNMPSAETMRDVSFESVKSHFRQRIGPRDLSRCKGGLAGRRRDKMTVFRSSTSSWWGKIIPPTLTQMALTQPEDN